MQSGLRASASLSFPPSHLLFCMKLSQRQRNCTMRKECISSSVSLHSEKTCTYRYFFSLCISVFIFFYFRDMCFITALICSHSLSSCSLPQTLCPPTQSLMNRFLILSRSLQGTGKECVRDILQIY